jgi:hypothetical protein
MVSNFLFMSVDKYSYLSPTLKETGDFLICPQGSYLSFKYYILHGPKTSLNIRTLSHIDFIVLLFVFFKRTRVGT